MPRSLSSVRWDTLCGLHFVIGQIRLIAAIEISWSELLGSSSSSAGRGLWPPSIGTPAIIFWVTLLVRQFFYDFLFSFWHRVLWTVALVTPVSSAGGWTNWEKKFFWERKHHQSEVVKRSWF